MIAIRHTGIYVHDIERLEKFYIKVFDMIPICRMQPDQGKIFDELLGSTNVKIMTTKLVTPYGKQKGQGEMIELVKVIDMSPQQELPSGYPISMTGMGHIAFGVDDMSLIVAKIKEENGIQSTKIYCMKNTNFCCFCRDPEGNWIELIQRGKEFEGREQNI